MEELLSVASVTCKLIHHSTNDKLSIQTIKTTNRDHLHAGTDGQTIKNRWVGTGTEIGTEEQGLGKRDRDIVTYPVKNN